MIKNLIIRIVAVLGYIVAFIVVFKNHNIIPAPLGTLTRDLFLIALAICFLTALVEFLRYPFAKRRFDNAFKKTG